MFDKRGTLHLWFLFGVLIVVLIVVGLLIFQGSFGFDGFESNCEILSGNEKDKCYLQQAMSLGNQGICDLISDSRRIDQCRERVNRENGQDDGGSGDNVGVPIDEVDYPNIEEGVEYFGDTITDYSYENFEVNLISEEDCDGDKCYHVGVECLGLETREADIRVYESTEKRGTAIFTTGGWGVSYLGTRDINSGKPQSEMILDLREEGFDSYEIAWNGPIGWGSHNEGAGYKATLCAYSAVVRWIEERAQNPEVMCATGNSGGSMQIGYGLALYNLEEVLDLAVMTGGPPSADIINICEDRPDGYLIDPSFGWPYNGAGCAFYPQPDWAINIMQKESLVGNELGYVNTPEEERDYDYPDTRASFIQGEFDLNNIPRAEKYFDQITSEKSFLIVEDTQHSTTSSVNGANAVFEEFIENCN